jgi:F-type H+-transporting ATPase subunit b
MSNIFDQLGINWQLLLSQAVNFFLLLIILTIFVYKPLLKVIKKRQEKIQEGLQKAEEADVRLKEVDEIAKAHLKKTNQEAIEIIKVTEQKAEALKQSLQKKAEDHQKELMAQAKTAYERQQEETQKLVFSQALELVKKTIIKTVELKPEIIDEALIKKAVAQVKDEV